MPRIKKLTESQEDQLLADVELGRKNTMRALEVKYTISRTTLLAAIKRAESRRKLSAISA